MSNEYDYGQTAEPDDSKDSLFEECPECGDYSSSQEGVEGCTSESCSRFMGHKKLEDYIDRAGYKRDVPADRGYARPSVGVDSSSALKQALSALPGHGSHHNDGEPEDQPPSYWDKVRSGEYDFPGYEGSEEDEKPSGEPGDFLPGDDYQPPF